MPKFTTVDKAGAGAIGSALAVIATHYLGVEVGASAGVLITAFLVWLARRT